MIARVAEFHEPDPKADFGHELTLIIDRLRLQAVEAELKMLFEAPTLSPDAQQRGKLLMAQQSRLKAQLVQTSPPL